MYCKTVKSKKYWVLLLLAGLVSLAFGIIGIRGDPEMAGDGAMLMGMFTGMGAALAGVSIFRLIYMAVASPKALKREEINVTDERHVQILRASYTVSNMAATLIFAVLAFVFVALGYRIPGICMAGAIWVQVVVFLISHRVYSRKM